MAATAIKRPRVKSDQFITLKIKYRNNKLGMESPKFKKKISHILLKGFQKYPNREDRILFTTNKHIQRKGNDILHKFCTNLAANIATEVNACKSQLHWVKILEESLLFGGNLSMRGREKNSAAVRNTAEGCSCFKKGFLKQTNK